jgi:hypothetical protein
LPWSKVKNAKHKAWCLKYIIPNIGIKKQPKWRLVNITRFNIEQDSGLCVADFEFFYGQLVNVNAFFGCIVQIYGNRTALQCSNGIGLKTMQTLCVQLLTVFYWLLELKNLLPKLIVAMQGSIFWPHGNLLSQMGGSS